MESHFSPETFVSSYRAIKVFPVQAMKAYGGADLQFHSFLISALDKGKQSGAGPGRFISGYQLSSRLVGPHTRSGRLEQRKILISLPPMEPLSLDFPARNVANYAIGVLSTIFYGVTSQRQ
jgi:hypothetical protein